MECRGGNTKMKKRILFLTALILLLVMFAAIVFLHQSSTKQMQANIQSEIPIGSSRSKVDAFIKAHGIDQAAFDYIAGDPRQGTLIIGVVDPSPLVRRVQNLFPALQISTIHVNFYFDHKGPDGKLIHYQVSDKFIPFPPP
jgi:hypothetical protein